MIIHTVKEGETIFHIARKYSLPPTKIIEDNAPCGISLTVGQQLLILTPTRTVTVRGGDTIAKICHRFSVKRSSVIANNPSLCGKDTLRPGQILAVKYGAPPLGPATAIGIYENGCTKDKYDLTLPYLTYVAICSAVMDENGISITFDASDAIRVAKTAAKVPLLGIRDTTDGKYLIDKAYCEKVINDMISMAKAAGYKGIYFCAAKAAKCYKDDFAAFLLEVRKRMIGSDLILFSRLEEDTPTDTAELSDGGVLFSESDGMIRFSDEAESGKIFVNLDSCAHICDEAIPISEAPLLASRVGAKIKTDEKSKISSFEFNRYKSGAREACKASYPSLEAIEAKLKSCAELGFMGVCFDIKNVPTSYLCMFNTQFSRADYSLFSSEAEI
jgi:spore germination protein YaaH